MRYRDVGQDPTFIDDEDIVAKLHFLEQLEGRWPYAPAKGVPLSTRLGRSLSRIPAEFHRFAIAAFSNVIYLPDALLRESWTYLASTVARELGIDVLALCEQSHLLEVDPSGLIPAFLHENKVHGRLDADRFSRLQSVEELATQLRLFALSEPSTPAEANSIRLAFSRRYWLLLSDFVLSGTSVLSDLARCQRLLSAYSTLGRPQIIPVVQVLTSAAALQLDPPWMPAFAMWFDERSRVLPGNRACHLFSSPHTLDGVVSLCEWLANQEWFANDPRLKATIQMSGDNMAFGFKGGGWTIVTPNCPTNSLPILWYENDGVYDGPFPRVMSRTSQAKGSGGQLTDSAIELAPRVLQKLEL